MPNNVPLPQQAHQRWGRADFFDTRRKQILVRLAELKPQDVFYDLGCGDASLLIYVVKKSGLNRAIGFENMPSRFKRSKDNVRKAGLDDRITIERDMYDADLGQADAILDMMPEGKNDLNDLYGERSGIKDGTKLIKHDLPLVGYLPDKADLPFYRMVFPLRNARTRDEWAQAVLCDCEGTVDRLWHELRYYCMEKAYAKWEIKEFDSMLRRRVPAEAQ